MPTRKVKYKKIMDEYEIYPSNVVERLRKKFRLNERGISDLFSLVVFLCDGLLQLSPQKNDPKIHRFFKIASQLPLELQSILCCRVFGSRKTFIPEQDREDAFKKLARVFIFH
jgi:hypothetical protein